MGRFCCFIKRWVCRCLNPFNETDWHSNSSKAIGKAVIANFIILTPVSYTHLDILLGGGDGRKGNGLRHARSLHDFRELTLFLVGVPYEWVYNGSILVTVQ